MKFKIVILSVLFAYIALFSMMDPSECYTYILQPSEKPWTTLYRTHKTEISHPQNAGKSFEKIWNNTQMECFKPTRFLFGLSSSAYQIEGGLDTHNTSASFYQDEDLPVAGNAIDFWHRYKTDIKQMKEELGITSFRLSIAWDRIEPQEGSYDVQAINHYRDIIKTLRRYNIEPIVVLHHYTIPQWFADNGGFEKKENIASFVSFAKKMYRTLGNIVQYWSTFNAPEAYAIKGYTQGNAAPGYINDWPLCQQVLMNMLDAHVQIYQAIKGPEGLYDSLSSQGHSFAVPLIGIQKNLILFDVAYNNALQLCTSPLSTACCMVGDILQNKGFYSFFSTGTFNVRIPSMVNAKHTNPLAPSSLDWIGLNFYSNMHMFIAKAQKETESKRMTENPLYRNYPEGIARAIQEIYTNIAKPLNLPIIITENGIATNEHEEKKRSLFFQRALFTIKTLINEGYPIIGYLPWSSHDGYEWPTKEFPNAFTARHYGFFKVDLDPHSPHYLERTLKPSSYYYRDFIKGYNKASNRN